MFYRQSFEIEQRLNATLRLIRAGRYSTPMLAGELRVSIPTVSRYVLALRDRGHNIRARRDGDSWRYVLIRDAQKPSSHNDPLPTASSAEAEVR